VAVDFQVSYPVQRVLHTEFHVLWDLQNADSLDRLSRPVVLGFQGILHVKNSIPFRPSVVLHSSWLSSEDLLVSDLIQVWKNEKTKENSHFLSWL
jgi:hypothetical protein